MISRALAHAFLCVVISIAAAPNVMAAPVSEEEPGSVSLVETNGKFTLQNNAGHSFYTYDKYEKNKSNCVDECTQNWGPAIAGAHAKPLGEWTLVDRGGGHMQWAYKGKPIYSNLMESESGVQHIAQTVGRHGGCARSTRHQSDCAQGFRPCAGLRSSARQ